MFYRRKFILSLLESFGGKIDKISLQKLVFLFTQKQENPLYDFIPFHYGCFSYSMSADLHAMIKKGILTENQDIFVSNEKPSYIPTLKEADKQLLSLVKHQYGKMNADALIKHTYVNYPYWAINSKIAPKILSSAQLAAIEKSRPISDETVLFTIGYEGISLEEYLNRLLKNDVKILVDVRRNPLSMKYGFSKSLLQRFCSSLGIEYLHIPEVGIQSEQRQELHSQADYDKLFSSYCQNNLKNTLASQQKILDLLKEKKRIALTCFEANICQCHRKHLAEAVKNLTNFNFEVKHI